jgi:crotonobetainyl-CoA:carnitine CoA-transferase CaiB-like acyl-CoA transferase
MTGRVASESRAPALRVLDLATHYSGPLAARILSDLGADVVSIEHPRLGDGNRGSEPLVKGEAVAHLMFNAGKRSVAVDRRSPEWPDVFSGALRWADVVIVGGLPEVLAGRGMDFASCCKINPRLVYCVVTGYGEVGPWRARPAHGLNADMAAGLVPVERTADGPRVRSDFRSAGTTVAGLQAAIGILEAVRRRDATGVAQRVSVSIWESAMFWHWRDVTTLANAGTMMPSYSDLGVRYAIYETGDNELLLICPIEQKFWERFCDMAGLPAEVRAHGDWSATGMDYGYEEEHSIIAKAVARRSAADWVEALNSAGIPYAEVLTPAAALASEQAQATGVLRPVVGCDTTFLVPRIPIDLADAHDEVSAGPELSLPDLGSDTAGFLRDIR